METTTGLSSDTQQTASQPTAQGGSAQNDIAQALVAVATVLFSFVSWYATREGLLLYFAPWMATALSLAVQLGLLGLAWQLRSRRSRTAVIYIFTMTFSVLFSFVFLQSELASPLRLQAQRRSLSDAIAAAYRPMSEQLLGAQRANAEVVQRIEGWIAAEKEIGFSVRTCGVEPLPYLTDVCARLRQRVAIWEAATGRVYKNGGGEGELFLALNSELQVVQADAAALNLATQRMTAVRESGVQVPNADRLQAYQAVVRSYPLELVRRYAGAIVKPPPSFSITTFDEVQDAHEAQWQAFDDLNKLLAGKEENPRVGRATAFSFGLAIFVDLVVLAIAFVSFDADKTRSRSSEVLSASADLPGDEQIEVQVGRWTRMGLLDAEPKPEEEETLITGIIEMLQPDGRGGDAAMTSEPRERRFLDAAARDGATKLATYDKTNRKEVFGYSTKPWFSAVLMQYLVLRHKHHANPFSHV